jgi:glycosyltransferase involved in cell wall biosynthesis
MIVVIPAYEPDDKLLGVLKDFTEQTAYAIVVVNDGSSDACRPVFDAVRSFDRVTLLEHEVNKGKGAAMKTAFSYIAEHFPASESVMTVDADGQHLVSDALRVAGVLEQNPDTLVLGSRRFNGNVPFKSRAGNAITRAVFRFCTGVRVYDTQTGLRAFSASRIPEMLALKGDRYEYEINQLIFCTKNRIPIVEEWIDTVYIEENKSSHFNAVKDSFRIYKVLLLGTSFIRFVGVSLTCFLIDLAMYWLSLAILGTLLPGSGLEIAISQAFARIVSASCNYFMNRHLVFGGAHSRMSIPKFILLAGVLCGLQILLSLLAVSLLGESSKWFIIIPVQLIIYPVSYLLQRTFIFRNTEKTKS